MDWHPPLVWPQDRLTDRERELVDANRGLAALLAIRAAHLPIEVDDRKQVAFVGLMAAARKFRPEKGFRFTTYATHWIRNYLARAAADGGFIRVPRYHASRDSQRSGSREKYAKDARAAAGVGRISWPGELPDREPNDRADLDDRLDGLRAAIAALPSRHRRVIRQRLQGRLLRTIAGEMGVTRQRVNQIEQEAHALIRRHVETQARAG